MTADSDRRGYAPPIKGRCAAMTMVEPRRKPQRLHRTRRKNASTPVGAIYVGRPTMWSNPFAGRPRVGHARSVILYRAWLAGDLSPLMLLAGGFSDAEVLGLMRWRPRILERLPTLAGRDLQCWCPPTSDWCHADVLLRLANEASA